MVFSPFTNRSNEIYGSIQFFQSGILIFFPPGPFELNTVMAYRDIVGFA